MGSPEAMHEITLEQLDTLGHRIAAHQSAQLRELLELLAYPSAVRSVPADVVRFSTLSYESGHEAQQIVGKSAGRRAITVVNSGLVAVQLGHDKTCDKASTSFPLAAGASIDVQASADLYVYVPAGTGQLSLIVEEWAT